MILYSTGLEQKIMSYAGLSCEIAYETHISRCALHLPCLTICV